VGTPALVASSSKLASVESNRYWGPRKKLLSPSLNVTFW
jgi:hypothetical protein